MKAAVIAWLRLRLFELCAVRHVPGAALLLIALALSASPAAATSLFSPPFISFDLSPDYAYGHNPSSVAIADLNGDGKLDLAMGLADASESLSVVMGDGAGHFGSATSYQAGGGPRSVALADVNGDGTLDLVSANGNTYFLGQGHSMSVFIGHPDGTFESHTDFETGNNPNCIAIHDLNGDGKPDAVVACAASGVVSVLLGNGSGGFGTRQDYPTGSAASFVAIGDFDRDGAQDLAVTNGGSNTVSVLFGVGDGSFGSKTDYATGDGPNSVAVADLDADGSLDLLVGCSGHYYDYVGALSVFKGGTSGEFSPRTDYLTGAGHYFVSVATADLDGDGALDIVVADQGDQKLSILLAKGGPRIDLATQWSPLGVAIADLNGDGHLDLAAACWAGMAIHLGNGNGSFGPHVNYAAGRRPSSIVTADLNEDGKLDLAVASSDSNWCSVLLGNGDGTLAPEVTFTAGSGADAVAAGDLDGDGNLDLAVANYRSSTVSVLLGDGQGTFGAHTDFPTMTLPRAVALGDLDGDGHLDVVVAGGGYTEDADDTVSVLLGNGDGSLQSRQDFETVQAPRSVALTDLNGDEHLDLVTAGVGYNVCGKTSVFLGNGDGTFQPRVDYGFCSYPTSVATGDLNGDGIPDLAVANHGSDATGTVSVFPGTGDGTFGPEVKFATNSYPLAVVIGDLDGDAKPDLAVSNGDNSVSVLLGHGNGTFEPRADFGTGSAPSSLALGNFNGDSKLDLVVANATSNTVSVLINSGGATTATLLSFFGAERTGDGVEVRWSWGASTPVAAMSLERSEAESGPWTVIDAEPHAQGEYTVMLDRSAVAEQAYFYRIIARLSGGAVETFGPLGVRASPIASSDLRVAPSPSAGIAQVEFAVRRAGWVRVRVMDVQGRAVATLADGMYRPGTHQATWNVRTGAGRVSAGILFVRLDAPGEHVTKRIVIAP